MTTHAATSRRATFTVQETLGAFKVRLHARNAVDDATAYVSRKELERIQAAITAALASKEQD
jgi:hypothetical protein